MKVLQISNYYKPHIGGIEQVAHDISESLKDNNEVRVISFSEDKRSYIDVVDGVQTYKCGFSMKISSQALSLSYSKTLKKVINEFKPDTIIFHYPNPFVAHYLLKYLKNKRFKLIVWYHADIIKQKILGKFFTGQTRKLLTYADRVITTSPIYKDASVSIKNFSDKTQVLPLCVDLKRLKESQNTLGKVNIIKDKVLGFSRYMLKEAL